MIETALVTYLRSQPGIAAMVGTRIYPMILPQDATLPAIAYNRVSTSPERDLSGAVRTRVRIQLTCFAETYGQAKQLAWQIRDALQDYSGPMGDVQILQADVVGMLDDYEPDLGRYIVPVDVMFLVEGGKS